MWFPERDPTANPADHGGYWGPWKSSAANKAILQKVVDTIPYVSEKNHSCDTNSTVSMTRIGKVFSTHEEHDKEVYQMLKKILKIANEGKKGQIPRNSNLMKESLAMLYAKMKQKTKIDDLMHKLQMIKKGRVAKTKGVKSGKSDKETLASKLSHINTPTVPKKSEKLMNKKHHKIDKPGIRRTEIENVAIRDDSVLNNGFENSLNKDNNSSNEDQNMEEISSLKENSDVKHDNDSERDDLMFGNSGSPDTNTDDQEESESDSEKNSSNQPPSITGQTSGEGSEMEFQ